MESRAIILKLDARGRVRTPVERREALVAEFERSGLSPMRFATLAGVRYSTFWTWLKIRKGDRPCKTAQAAGNAKFVEVVSTESSPNEVHYSRRVVSLQC